MCTLYIQQVHPNEIFNRLEAQPCAHRPLDDLSPFGFHATHTVYNMGAVLLCTKCFAVHKPGQLSLAKVLRETCEGASRAHKKRKTEWTQKYLKETTNPTELFKTMGTRPQAEQHRPLSQASAGAAEPKQATNPQPEAKPRRGEAASPAANSVPANLCDPKSFVNRPLKQTSTGAAEPKQATHPKPKVKPRRGEDASPAANPVPDYLSEPGTARLFSARPKPSRKQNPELDPKVKQKLLLLLQAHWPRPSQKQQECDLQITFPNPVFPAALHFDDSALVVIAWNRNYVLGCDRLGSTYTV